MRPVHPPALNERPPSAVREVPDLVAPGSPEEATLRALDLARLPRHVAIIMDGNGRWAAQRRQPRIFGHRAGIESVREAVEASARLGLEVLTLFAFSRENWKRPKDEVSLLMDLLREYVRRELDGLHERGIRFRAIGRIEDLPAQVQADLQGASDRTAANAGMVFNVALSYGARSEIVDACRALAAEAAASGAPSEITEESFAARLTTGGLPDPDLVIRTSGEHRLSNFLLWQSAYAELWTTETLWPDFRRGHLLQAVLDYQGRERRYGGL